MGRLGAFKRPSRLPYPKSSLFFMAFYNYGRARCLTFFGVFRHGKMATAMMENLDDALKKFQEKKDAEKNHALGIDG
jgi:hypothetical protein